VYYLRPTAYSWARDLAGSAVTGRTDLTTASVRLPASEKRKSVKSA